MALYLDVEPGDTVRIGGNTTVRFERKSGQRGRLRIDTDYKVTLDRGDAVQRPQPNSTTNHSTLTRPKVGQT